MPANHHIVNKKWRPPSIVLGGQSRTPGPTLSANGPTLVASSLYYYVATKDGKNSRAPTEYKLLQEKNSNITKKKIQRRRKTVTTPCLYCSEVYSRRKAGEGWMKCGECDLWAHKSVQGMNVGRPSLTFVTKTGVAHFTLQF